jgi:hypothetical protein
MEDITVRAFMEELLKKARKVGENMWFESQDKEYLMVICSKEKVIEMIELAIEHMEGVQKEIFENMLTSSIAALEQVKQKQKEGEQL